MGDVRFVALPRREMYAALAEMPGWRQLGYRMRDRAEADCPVSERESGDDGSPHLKDSIEVRFIGGEDPRILIGSKQQTTGDNPVSKLALLTDGTDAHYVGPVNVKALHWVSGGEDFFSAGHQVSGIEPNPFVIDAMRTVLHES